MKKVTKLKEVTEKLGGSIIGEIEVEATAPDSPYQELSPYPHCVLPRGYFSAGPKPGRTLVSVRRRDGSELFSVKT